MPQVEAFLKKQFEAQVEVQVEGQLEAPVEVQVCDTLVVEQEFLV